MGALGVSTLRRLGNACVKVVVLHLIKQVVPRPRPSGERKRTGPRIHFGSRRDGDLSSHMNARVPRSWEEDQGILIGITVFIRWIRLASAAKLRRKRKFRDK